MTPPGDVNTAARALSEAESCKAASRAAVFDGALLDAAPPERVAFPVEAVCVEVPSARCELTASETGVRPVMTRPAANPQATSARERSSRGVLIGGSSQCRFCRVG